MKAVVYEIYGPPGVLQVKEIEKPIPGEDEILIKVYAAEVSKSDCEMRGFNFQVKWFSLPLRLYVGVLKPRRPVLGGYFAGVVESVGNGVSPLHPGDAVFGAARLRMGAHSEYICLPTHYTIAPMPRNLSFNEAAAVPFGGMNALHFMRKAGIRSGEKVLIIGAGGSIGTFAVQIAKAKGAEVTVVDSGIKEPMLRAAGADRFIDYTRQEALKTGDSYDVILNMVAGMSYADCIGALNPNGRYLMANPRLSDMLKSVFVSKFTDKTSLFAFADEKEAELLELKKMIEENKIRPVVDKVYPFDQATEAHRRVETEQRLGVVVISMNSDSGDEHRQ